MALLHALHTLSHDMQFALQAAHFDHQLRPNSAQDALVVRRYCEQLGVVVHSGGCDVNALGGNTENAARQARYEYLHGVTGAEGVLATAHHQADLAESVLMNVLRGAGTRGMQGIRGKRDNIVRPLLYIPKQDIDDYIAEHAIPFCIDESNAYTTYTRNRVRHKLIPLLQQEYNPAVLDALERAARHAAEDEQCLTEMAEDVYIRSAVRKIGDVFIELHTTRLAEWNAAVAKRTLRMACELLGVYDIDEDMMHQMFHALPYKRRVDVGRGIFVQGGERALVYRMQPFIHEQTVQGEGRHKLGHMTLDVTQTAKPEAFPHGQGWQQFVDARYKDKPLCIRKRRDGDRMRPLGAGSKPLGDIMTDKKIPLALREALPVVECDGQIIWAVGVGLAEQAKVTDADAVLQLDFSWKGSIWYE